MSKIVVIGAGQTGRGFIGRLLAEADQQIMFVDSNLQLIEALRAAGEYTVRFYGNKKPPVTVKDYIVCGWDDADFLGVELIFVSVAGQNLPAVGKMLHAKLSPLKNYVVIACENSKNPAGVLQSAIGLSCVSTSEATVFCTTINDGPCDIWSQDYPYLQFDTDRLNGYDPSISGILPYHNFGDLLMRKLYTYNATSCIIAYLGWAKAYTNYASAANDAQISELTDRYLSEINRAMCQEYGYDCQEQRSFAEQAKEKFCCREIVDTVERNARQPQRKLAADERIIGPMKLIDKHGGDVAILAMTVAAALCYESSSDPEWTKYKAGRTPETILSDLCGLPAEHYLHGTIMQYYRKFAAKQECNALPACGAMDTILVSDSRM